MGYGLSDTRRGLLNSAAVVAFASTAGCTHSGGTQSEPEKQKSTSKQENKEADISGLEDAERRIIDIVSDLNSVPVAEGDDLVFQVGSFSELPHEELMDSANSVLNYLLNEHDQKNTHAEYYTRLVSESRIAYLRIELRLLINDITIYGIKYRQNYTHGEYGVAAEAIEKGEDAIDHAPKTIDHIKKEVSSIRDHSGRLQSLKRIKKEISALKDIIEWSEPAYNGFKHAANGIQLIKNQKAPEDQSRTKIGGEYNQRIKHEFGEADRSFRAATGQGQAIPELKEIFEDLRCIAPDVERAISDAKTPPQNQQTDTIDKNSDAEAFREIIQSTNRCL